MSLSNIIYWAIDAVIKRSFLIAFVGIAVYLLAKKNSRICERYPDTVWNTKSVYQLLFLFLIIEYLLPFLLGGIFYRDFTAFFQQKELLWRDSLAGLIFVSFVLGTILGVVTYKYNQSFTIVGFRKDKFGLGLAWGFGALLFFEILFIYLKSSKNISISSGNNQYDLLWIISSTVIGPIAEEVFSRGYIYPNFRKRVGIGWAILLSSVCFAILHQAWEDWPSIFITGIVLCFMYEKTGSLIAPIMGHVFKNVFGVIIDYRSETLIYLTPWPLVWTFLILTVVIYFLILTYVLVPVPKTCFNSFPAEIKKPTIEDSEKIIKNAVGKGWIVAIILGATIMYFIYFFRK